MNSKGYLYVYIPTPVSLTETLIYVYALSDSYLVYSCDISRIERQLLATSNVPTYREKLNMRFGHSFKSKHKWYTVPV